MLILYYKKKLSHSYNFLEITFENIPRSKWANYYLIGKVNVNNGAKIKILHISTFDERNDHRLFNISIAHKLSKGFIRNGHDVINFSYRNYLDKNLLIDKNETVNKKTLSICNNYLTSSSSIY